MTAQGWEEATFEGHERAQRRRALALTPAERLAAAERLVSDAARCGVLDRLRERRQREVLDAWESGRS